jgi:DNA-binding LacI/PurR family transcriptional regulator
MGRFVTKPSEKKKTGFIGVILYDMNHPVTSRALRGMNLACEPEGYHLNIYAINKARNNPAFLERIRENLAGIDPEKIDGLMIKDLEPELLAGPLQDLARRIPVFLCSQSEFTWNLTVGTEPDYAGGAFEAVRHLRSLGHRHIALVTVDTRFHHPCEQCQGARLAMKDLVEAGQGSLTTFFAEDFTVTDGRLQGEQLARRRDQFTAVICGAHELTVGVYEALSRAGVRVPQDLSLVSWNDLLTPGDIPVPLTTVDIDFQEIGRYAMSQLIRQIEDPETPIEPKLVPARLIVRESTQSV